MRIDRLFEIVYILLNKKKTTTKELAERFGVTKRTVLRDLETLTVAGVPIYTSPGKSGGVFLPDNFVLDKTALSAEEREQILIGLRTLAPTGQIGAEGILAKLGAMFAAADTDWLEVDFSRWGSAERDRDRFARLKRAVLERRAATFTYPSAAGRIAARTVYPLKLIFKSNSWYVQAYCLLKKDYRIFKLNRILNLEILSETFDARQFTPPPLPTESVAAPPVRLKLTFSPEAAYRVFDDFDPLCVSANADGSFSVDADLPADNWLYGYLLSFGAGVTVLAPREVRERLSEIINKLRKIYAE